MTEQKKNEEKSISGKYLANALYILTVLLVLGFFMQSFTSFVLVE